ncbi:NAD(P)-binding protein [Candidatus Parcubacteria bacterium]|nr:NAD(P)-binding protein [Candidatus Parcubacteria bacterium]
MDKIFKIAIVGAGTVGLYLAWKLSKLGHKVVVFEKKNEIEKKVCSGLISGRLRNFIPLDENLIEHKINSCLIHFPKKKITLNMKPVHLIVDRQKLNTFLFSLAQDSGAEILFGQSTVPPGFNRVIGCDGALSATRKKLGLSQPFFRLGLQVFHSQEDYSQQVDTWPIDSGFCWKIPRGKNVEYGAIGKIESVKEEFDKFLSQENIPASEKIEAALIPQGLILPKTGETTLCGDAMGLTKPWSGGGVIWGLTAADILLESFPDFGKYRQKARRFFLPKLYKARISVPLTYILGNNFPFFLPTKISRDNDFPLI